MLLIIKLGQPKCQTCSKAKRSGLAKYRFWSWSSFCDLRWAPYLLINLYVEGCLLISFILSLNRDKAHHFPKGYERFFFHAPLNWACNSTAHNNLKLWTVVPSCLQALRCWICHAYKYWKAINSWILNIYEHDIFHAVYGWAWKGFICIVSEPNYLVPFCWSRKWVDLAVRHSWECDMSRNDGILLYGVTLTFFCQFN